MRRALVVLFLVLGGSAWAAEPSCAGVQLGAAYPGPMIDAMAQIEAGMSDTVSGALEKSGVARMALFARLHRKRNGEAEVLSLKRRFPQRFFVGTPKPLDQQGDLSSHFVDRTAAHLKDERYQAERTYTTPRPGRE